MCLKFLTLMKIGYLEQIRIMARYLVIFLQVIMNAGTMGCCDLIHWIQTRLTNESGEFPL